MASFTEKVGYGFGDLASSMYWKIFVAYLPFFYSNIYGLSLEATALLLLVSRLWDAVSDPMMGIIADRTHSRWGKYRPWLLWMALPFALAGVLLFVTPHVSQGGKTAWAFFTYILMMTVYTGINVPYGSMLGVMTDKSEEKTVFSSFRMFFAYAGSFVVLAMWEPLCLWFKKHFSLPQDLSWTCSMGVVAIVCFLLFLFSFALTREHIIAPRNERTSIKKDLLSLFSNKPWWILLGAVLTFNFFGAIRYSVVPYFFASVVGGDASFSIFCWTFLFYSGLFLAVGEIANMVGVVLASPIARCSGKKKTFALSLLLLIVANICFYYIPIDTQGFLWMLILQVFISILTGIISPLIWSMYADVSDYAELKHGVASTGLIFSSSSMAQKFGGAIGGTAVVWLLAFIGYNTDEGAVQTAEAIDGIRILISYVPALVAAISLLFIMMYPLTTKRMEDINSKLAVTRK